MKYFNISINTKENDSVDIKCGGPRFLGFDFKVQKSPGLTIKSVSKMFESLLKELNISYLSLHVVEKDYIEPKWWTFKEIREEIENYKE
jgi:hypothetical protein